LSVNLVVYDLDGTLIDSANTVLSIINQMRSELNKNLINRNSLMPWISLGGIKFVINDLDLQEVEADKYLIEFRRRYLAYCTKETDLYPDVQKTLSTLAISNKYLAICTNKPRNLVEKILFELSLEKYFEFVIAGGDLATQKPHPSNLLECLKHFGCSPDSTIMVGDSTVDQRLANNCGVPFVFFRPGYDDGVDPQKAFLTLDIHSDLLLMHEL
jgi:phosphoglycolate phosphatase